MCDYNYEYKQKGQYSKYKTSNKYQVPIQMKINNKSYRQEQLGFIRSLFPNGISKQIKLNEEDQVDIIGEEDYPMNNNSINVIIIKNKTKHYPNKQNRIIEWK